MIRRPPRSTLSSSSAASDVYKRQNQTITFEFGLIGLILASWPFRGKTIKMRRRRRRRRENNKNEEEEEEEEEEEGKTIEMRRRRRREKQ